MIGLNKINGDSITTVSEHIHQSVADIITTPVGTRLMRRTYGSVIPDLIDQPINSALILKIYAATAGAIMQWEPRFNIISVKFSNLKQANATIEVTGKIDAEPNTISIPLTARSEPIKNEVPDSQRHTRWFNGINQSTTIQYKAGDTLILDIYSPKGNAGLPKNCPALKPNTFDRVQFTAIESGVIGQTNDIFFEGCILFCQVNQSSYPMNDPMLFLKDNKGLYANQYLNKPLTVLMSHPDPAYWQNVATQQRYPISHLLQAVEKHGHSALITASQTFHQSIHHGGSYVA